MARTDQHTWTPSQFKPKDLKDAYRNYGSEGASTWANADNRRKSAREYSLGEEIANSVSHCIGAVLAIAGMTVLVVKAALLASPAALTSALVYGICMILCYTISTLYHAIPQEGAKRVFKILDHIGIYLFIAGSYTPFCLITLSQNQGLLLGCMVWGLALLGSAIEAFWVMRPCWISAIIYVALGWLVVFFLPSLVSQLNPIALALLATGGVCYTVGAIFYTLKKIAYMHMVFHLFVLAGSIFQYFCICLFVI